MKYLILSASIFYLLGVKMTNKIEINQELKTDTLKISIPAKIELPDFNNKINLIIEPLKDENGKTTNNGATLFFAPKSNHMIEKND